MQIYKQLIVMVCISITSIACNEHDLGTNCGIDRSEFTREGEIIIGEIPLVGEIEIFQDGICESFICLNHLEMPPYCSRTCDEFDPCPDGFECSIVQELGSRADEMYCVWSSCTRESDCKDIKKYRCSQFTFDDLTYSRCQLRNDDDG